MAIYNELGVNAFEIASLNHWLRETGVQIDLDKNASGLMVRVFKDMKPLEPHDGDLEELFCNNRE